MQPGHYNGSNGESLAGAWRSLDDAKTLVERHIYCFDLRFIECKVQAWNIDWFLRIDDFARNHFACADHLMDRIIGDW